MKRPGLVVGLATVLTAFAPTANAASNTCTSDTVVSVAGAGVVGSVLCTVSVSASCPDGGSPCTVTYTCTITGTGVVGCFHFGDGCGPAVGTCTSVYTSTIPAGATLSGTTGCAPQNTVATDVTISCSFSG